MRLNDSNSSVFDLSAVQEPDPEMKVNGMGFLGPYFSGEIRAIGPIQG